MFRLPAVRRLHRWIPHFAASERGNVAVLFALFLVPVLSFIGMAIDYGRAARARSAMQSALDSTALMLSRDLSQNTISVDDIETKASQYFQSLYTDVEAKGVSIKASYAAPTSTTASGFTLTASGYIVSDFMQIAGFPTLGFGTKTSTQWGNARLRVALVLDNTGSMDQNNKLTTLKTVTAGPNGLIDQLSALAKNDGDVLISLVPFARVVNVAGGYINPEAIKPTGRTVAPTDIILPANWATFGPKSSCPWTGSSPTMCIDENTGQAITTLASTGTICPAPRESTTTTTVSLVDHTRYTGCWDSQPTGAPGNYTHTYKPMPLSCIADRDPFMTSSDTAAQPDTEDLNTLFPAFVWGGKDGTASCPPNGSAAMQRVIPLSSNWSSLKSAVNGMVAVGNTDQGIGIQVGVQTLIPGGAFNPPEEADPTVTNYQRYIIVLSDGANTQDRWSNVQKTIDDRQAKLCTSINSVKDASNQPLYSVFTVQLDTGTKKDGKSTVLQGCATDPSQYYYLTNANQLGQVFQDIGNSIGKLRLTN